MASSSSLVLSPLSSATAVQNRELSSRYAGSAFTHNLLFAARPRKASRRCGFKSPVARKSLDHVPKQFREENLQDGLMDNYKDAHKFLYGLAPNQMDLFTKENSLFHRQTEQVNEEHLTAMWNYMNHGGMGSMASISEKNFSKFNMNHQMYGGGGRRRRPRNGPPDLPTLLLDSRIIYLGMSIVPAVCELIISQFMYLDYEDQTKPIYLYINSPGILDLNGRLLDLTITHMRSPTVCRANVYTVAFGGALGQAAMLLSLGTKGKRGILPNTSILLHLPKMNRLSGASTDTWIQGKELETAAQSYIELMAKGTGKSKEEITRDLQHGELLRGQAVIDYGVADQILTTLGGSYDRANMEGMLAKTKAAQLASGGPRASPSGSR